MTCDQSKPGLPDLRTAEWRSLLHFERRLLCGYSLLLFLVCRIQLDLFLHRLLVHGLRGFVAHNLFTFRLLVC